MEILPTILQLHVGGAMLLSMGLVAALASVSWKLTSLYKTLLIGLPVAAFFMIASGVALIWLQNGSGIAAFCAKAGIYLSLTGLAEYAVWQRFTRAKADIQA